MSVKTNCMLKAAGRPFYPVLQPFIHIALNNHMILVHAKCWYYDGPCQVLILRWSMPSADTMVVHAGCWYIVGPCQHADIMLVHFKCWHDGGPCQMPACSDVAWQQIRWTWCPLPAYLAPLPFVLLSPELPADDADFPWSSAAELLWVEPGDMAPAVASDRDFRHPLAHCWHQIPCEFCFSHFVED